MHIDPSRPSKGLEVSKRLYKTTFYTGQSNEIRIAFSFLKLRVRNDWNGCGTHLFTKKVLPLELPLHPTLPPNKKTPPRTLIHLSPLSSKGSCCLDHLYSFFQICLLIVDSFIACLTFFCFGVSIIFRCSYFYTYKSRGLYKTP